MNLSPEDKQRFLELALAKQYLSPDLLEKWGFLSVEEFLHNRYMTSEQYYEILGQVTGQIFPQATPTPAALPLVADATDVPVAKPKKVIKLTKATLPKQLVKPTTAAKEVVEQVQVNPVSANDPEDWRLARIQEIEAKLAADRRLVERIRLRTKLNIASSRRGTIIFCGISVLVLGIASTVIYSLVQMVIALALGSAGGWVLHKLRGFGGTYGLCIPYLSLLLISVCLGFSYSPLQFLPIAFASVVALSVGNLLGGSIASVYSNC